MLLKRQEQDGVIKALYDSSNIIASVYETEVNNLTLIFKNGGQYMYVGVPKNDYILFENAESQGKVVNSLIKRYAFTKLGVVDATELITEQAALKGTK